MKNKKYCIPGKITCLLLVCCLIFTTAYTLIMYFSEKNTLMKTAQLDYNHAFETIQRQHNYGETFFTLLNAETEINTTLFTNDKKNTHIIITDKNYNVSSETENCYVGKIYSHGVCKEVFMGFKNFRLALSDEQYADMTKHLKNAKYRIVCTKFAVGNGSDKMLMPNEFTLVDADNTPIKTYITSNNEPLTYYTNKNLIENIIPADFILNKNNNNIIGSLKNTDIKDNIASNGLFSFVFYNNEDFVFNNDDEKNVFSFEYARKYNVLDSCIAKIICGDIIILLFFALIWIMLWRIFKKEKEEEINRRNLTNTMAHSLKTPLFVISGYAENLIENVQTQKREHYAKIIKNQTEEMTAQIHQMLEFSGVNSEEFVIEKEAFNLSDFTENIIKSYQDVNKKITIDADENAEIKADKRLMKTALENLIDNALKYSTGKITIKIKGNSFIISNPAELISKAQLKQLWLPYFKIDNSNNRNGNGLGLSIVKSIFEMHKFRYSAEYETNVFTVKFYFK